MVAVSLKKKYAALVPCIWASLTAYMLAKAFHAPFENLAISSDVTLNFGGSVRVILLAVLCAFVSILFCKTMHGIKALYARFFPNPFVRAFTGGVIIILLSLLLRTDDYLGPGMNIIERALHGETAAFAFLLKILFTALTIGAGFKGGEIVPSFFTGATFGCLFAILFERLDEDYKTGVPIFVAMMIYSVIMLARIVFRSYGTIEFEAFMIPVINLFITFLFVLAVLRFYCAVVIDREKGRFLEINDQEFELLSKYKGENPQLYYNAIHTAYFAEKAARLFHMDVDVAKNGGYYHKIIANECKKEDKSLEEICRLYRFPDKAVKLLQEYNYKSEFIVMKETAVVYLADAVVSSIMYLLEKDENKEVDFVQLATAVLKRKIDSGVLNHSNISVSELCGMEKLFTGEKLYYDFLRRE